MSETIRAPERPCRSPCSRQQARIRWTVAVFVTLAGAGCSGRPYDGPPADFALLTDAGPILIAVDGFSHGLTHSGLVEAVRKGLVRADRGRVGPFEQTEAVPARSLLLHVEEGSSDRGRR